LVNRDVGTASVLAVKYEDGKITRTEQTYEVALGAGSEPWQVPHPETFPTIDPDFATGPNHETESGQLEFWPYQRDRLIAPCEHF